MSAIDNAVDLMNSGVLLNKVKAVSVYVARQVVVEAANTPSHSTRMKMAEAVVWNPMQYNALLQNIVACDPDICGPTGDADNIADTLLIDKVSSIWTPVSNMLFPAQA